MSLEEILAQYSHMGIRFGRDIGAGYARGHGLAFRNLPEIIRAEEDFQEAWRLMSGRSVCTESRLMNLYILLRFFLPKLNPGAIIEFGSYRGGSAIFMASLAKRHLPATRVWALDTFEGMPETDGKVDLHVRGQFSDIDLKGLRAYVTSCNLPNLTFVQGLFEETAQAVLQEARHIALAHIDCDIQSAILYTWKAIKPYMVPGGYVIFDDATEPSCLGATEVVEREIIREEGLCSEQISPHYVFRYPPL